ncbi:MAG: hypothetical protein NY202_03025 [Mollicutes bacterium UO1]
MPKKLFFADFVARSKVLEFISQHKYPAHYQQKPYQKEKFNK